MNKTSTSSPNPGSVIRSLFAPDSQQGQIAATIFALVYVLFATWTLINLDRSSLWYPSANIVSFTVFVLSPIVILSLPIPRFIQIAMMAVALIGIMPLVGIYNSAYLELAIQICIFAGLALGLNIVVGFAGLLDLGYVAFFAVGAYLWGMFTSGAPTIFNVNGLLVPAGYFYIFLLIAVVAAGIVGILLGLPVLRLRGDYLAIVTLGFGEMIRVLVRNFNDPINFTNGAQGLHGISSPPLPNALIDLTRNSAQTLSVRVENPETVAKQLLFYFLSIAILGIIIVVARRLEDSPIGRAWTAIREDEVAAIAMGVPLVRMKLLAFASGAAFGGAIGVLYAAKQTFIDPNSFVLLQSISILAMVIVGGLGGIRGVILGACIITLLDLHILSNLSLQLNALRNANFVVPIFNYPIRNWPNQLEPAKYQPLVFGLILVIMMITRPAGLLPERRRRLELAAHPAAPAEGSTNPVVDRDSTPDKNE